MNDKPKEEQADAEFEARIERLSRRIDAAKRRDDRYNEPVQFGSYPGMRAGDAWGE
jgi:hypothetical protein